MAILYEPRVDGDLLRVKTSGSDDSLDEVKRYGDAIVAACASNGCTRLLIDELELEYKLDALDTYEYAQHLSAKAPGVLKAAVVCNSRFVQDAQFWETIVTNRGLHVKIFTSMEDASIWIGCRYNDFTGQPTDSLTT